MGVLYVGAKRRRRNQIIFWVAAVDKTEKTLTITTGRPTRSSAWRIGHKPKISVRS